MPPAYGNVPARHLNHQRPWASIVKVPRLPEPEVSLMTRILEFFRSVVRLRPSSLTCGCLLLGHHDLIRRHGGRMYLECCECGRTSPGWTIGNDRQRRLAKARHVNGGPSHLVVAA
jgi:hypothetical protein